MSYKEILTELSGALGFALAPDDHNTCLIELNDNLHVQIEPGPEGRYLVLGMMLGQAPVGAPQERLFRRALIENGLQVPCYGTLAYSKKSGEFVLFSFLHMQDLTGEMVADHYHPFIEKGRLWHEALQRGEVPGLKTEDEE